MTTLAIIQARATSTRLPNKVMMPLGGVSVLGHVILRCRSTAGVDEVCCAVPDGRIHDEVAAEARTYGAKVYRGSEHDVLNRFAEAAKANGADEIMRVTSDCPLADPAVCAQVLSLRRAANVDYACNNMPPTWPHGLDCEVFTKGLLNRANLLADEPYHREHVTPWMRVSRGISRANLFASQPEYAAYRWTLDFPEDYIFFKRLFDLLPSYPCIPQLSEVVELLRAHPEIALENQMHIDAGRHTKKEDHFV